MAHTIRELASKLPDECVTRLNTTNKPILIRFGVSGYYPVPAYINPDTFNAERGITPIQVEAMENGSMFGWEVPGADPDYLAATYAELAAKKAGR